MCACARVCVRGCVRVSVCVYICVWVISCGVYTEEHDKAINFPFPSCVYVSPSNPPILNIHTKHPYTQLLSYFTSHSATAWPSFTLELLWCEERAYSTYSDLCKHTPYCSSRKVTSGVLNVLNEEMEYSMKKMCNVILLSWLWCPYSHMRFACFFFSDQVFKTEKRTGRETVSGNKLINRRFHTGTARDALEGLKRM